jgi:subtilisin family serine protease
VADQPKSPTSGAPEAQQKHGTDPGAIVLLQRRIDTYLVGNDPNLAVQGVAPIDMRRVAELLDGDPEVQLHRTLTPGGVVGELSEQVAPAQSIVVASMPADRVRQLQSLPQLLVEPDQPLTIGLQPEVIGRDPGVVLPFGRSFTTTIAVTDPDSRGLPDAEVFVFGSFLPAQGTTDASGIVTITMRGESRATIRAVYINPKTDYWNVYVEQPDLIPDAVNAIAVQPLSATFTGFPDQQQLLGWGERIMGVNELPADWSGTGVRVAVIDSGAAATTHRDLLNRVKAGIDTTGDTRDTWNVDTVSHGTHCLGIIGGISDKAGIRGFAPDAEIHVCKIFPGGRTSSLIDALDYCVQNEIDVANLSLGSAQPSQLLRQRIQLAREAGVACIVAAGNSSGPVQYPAAYEEVLTVAAIGQRGQFPPGSYHSAQILDGGKVSADGFFSAKFSCHGPEVDVCAPGVAIVSCVPPDNYAAWDGTSMATPHVTGLAALVLAHHPDFQTTYRKRDAARVERLFQIIKSSATPLDLGDPTRTGVGVPNALVALGRNGAPRPATFGGNGGVDFTELESVLAQAGLHGRGAGTPPAATAAASLSAALSALEQTLHRSGLPVNV